MDVSTLSVNKIEIKISFPKRFQTFYKDENQNESKLIRTSQKENRIATLSPAREIKTVTNKLR